MLQLIDVCSGYKNRQVLHSINLEVVPNEILVIIGLNGSGKSTLLKTALGLLPPLRGKILVNRKPINELKLKERTQWVSLLESQPRLSFFTTVKELLEVACRGRHDLSEEALIAVGLKGFEDKNILELSSGESHRAFLAHALATNSKCIMIDEPFAHLDWSHQSELVESFKKWKKKFGTTFILAIHELERTVQIADRLAVLNEGRLMAIGSPQEIFTSKEVFETFAFKAAIDKNPLDGSKRLTLGRMSDGE
jgi:ABC-type cobalamin/Fe3+-siderophores transport system ATPase subunit